MDTPLSQDEHGLPNPYDDPRPRPLAWAFVIGTLSVVVLILALVALYRQMEVRYTERVVYASPHEQVRLLHSQQEAALHTIKWVDKQKGIVAIPIDRAMSLVARELRAARPTEAPRVEARP